LPLVLRSLSVCACHHAALSLAGSRHAVWQEVQGMPMVFAMCIDTVLPQSPLLHTLLKLHPLVATVAATAGVPTAIALLSHAELGLPSTDPACLYPHQVGVEHTCNRDCLSVGCQNGCLSNPPGNTSSVVHVAICMHCRRYQLGLMFQNCRVLQPHLAFIYVRG
jgi:hypothetical protein